MTKKFAFKFSIYLLNRLRVIFRSFEKKQTIIENFITFLKWKLNYKKKDLTINFDPEKNRQKDKKLAKNIAVTIPFYFTKKKISYLKKICKNLYEISRKCDVVIITNVKSKKIHLKLIKSIRYKRQKIRVYCPKELSHPRFLPWSHIPIMKRFIKNKLYDYFLYLEDDISISKENIIYWIELRKYIKKYNLIPGFIRTEINIKNNKIYAIDFVKKNRLSILPKLYTKKNKLFLTNTSFPYQGMYFYDRKLMSEHLNGITSNPDYGHGLLDLNYMNSQVINQSLLDKANIALIYKDTPVGFRNRIVVPVSVQDKKIKNYCTIKHLSNKYSNSKSSFGNISIENIFI